MDDYPLALQAFVQYRVCVKVEQRAKVFQEGAHASSIMKVGHIVINARFSDQPRGVFVRQLR